jgi:hypothetical protein
MQCHRRPRLLLFIPGWLVDPAPSDPSLADGKYDCTWQGIRSKGRHQPKDRGYSIASCCHVLTEHSWLHTLGEARLGNGEKARLLAPGTNAPAVTPGRIFVRIRCGPLTRSADSRPGPRCHGGVVFY